MKYGTRNQELFADRKLGLFIHWGLYAIDGRGEWALHSLQLDPAEYEALQHQFRGERFDADAIARLAVECGMTYVSMTAKHHDGFCLFDSALTDYTTAKSAAGRDFMGELAEACRRHGLGFHPYYSLWDWHHPDYVPYDREPQRPYLHRRWQGYLDYYQGQVRELCTKYGPITGMFFDAGGGDFLEYDFDRTVEIIRSVQPDASIMWHDHWPAEKPGAPNATGRPTFAGHPQLNTQYPGVFEFNETVNDHWAYVPGDSNFKSSVYLQQYFLETVGNGGNFLLNVGPRPDGSIDDGSVRALRGLGRFVTHYRRALFGARAEGHPRVNPFGVTMKKDDHAYFFLTEQTRLLDELAVAGDPLATSVGEVPVTFTGVRSQVEAVQTFDGMPLAYEQRGVNLRVTLPRQALSWPRTVIDVKTRGTAIVDGIVRPEQDGSYRLTPEWAAIYTPKLGAPHYRPAAQGLGVIANWSQAAAIAEWLIEVPTACCVKVEIEQACPPDVAGSMYVIEIKRPCENVDRCGALHLTNALADVRAAQANKGISRLPGVVQGTASDNEFRRVALGAVELPAGLVSVAVRPRTLVANRLMDIRGLALIPEKAERDEDNPLGSE
jgi:alpha-L-fucosidase